MDKSDPGTAVAQLCEDPEGYCSKDEKDADLYAFLLLNGKGYSQAKQYLIDTFFERHGEPFDVTMIDKFK